MCMLNKGCQAEGSKEEMSKKGIVLLTEKRDRNVTVWVCFGYCDALEGFELTVEACFG